MTNVWSKDNIFYYSFILCYKTLNIISNLHLLLDIVNTYVSLIPFFLVFFIIDNEFYCCIFTYFYG